MNRNDATRTLARLIGKGFAWREDPKALTGEEREAARAEYRAARAAVDAAREARDARREAVLAADADYQATREAVKAADLRLTAASSGAHRNRLTVGSVTRLGGLGDVFNVTATGDNWQEVVDKVKAKKAK